MVIASELRGGVVVRIEGQIYKVLEVESKAGAAKMSGVVRTKLINMRSGTLWEPHFRPLEKLEDIELDRRMMEFLFAEGDTCTFMRPDTFEQLEIPSRVIGPAANFLQPGMEAPVEFFGDEALSVVLPEVAEARVASTAPPSHSPQDNAWKEATLENGLKIRVPLFVGPGETVRVDVRSDRYVERARGAGKRSA
jgi:elongation factor P